MELSYFELLQMGDVSISRLESVFQFWLSATFAAIVASHLAGDKLTKIYAGMLSSLYLVFTFSVIVRMIAWRDTLQSYFAALSAIRGEQGGAARRSASRGHRGATHDGGLRHRPARGEGGRVRGAVHQQAQSGR